MKVVIAGGAGALGRRLAADAADRGEVVILTRSTGRTDLSGGVHLTAPEPIRNRDMMASLRRASPNGVPDLATAMVGTSDPDGRLHLN